MGLFTALAVTLGLCGAALWLLRRFAPGALTAGRGLTLRVLQRVSIGPRQGVPSAKRSAMLSPTTIVSPPIRNATRPALRIVSALAHASRAAPLTARVIT